MVRVLSVALFLITFLLFPGCVEIATNPVENAAVSYVSVILPDSVAQVGIVAGDTLHFNVVSKLGHLIDSLYCVVGSDTIHGQSFEQDGWADTLQLTWVSKQPGNIAITAVVIDRNGLRFSNQRAVSVAGRPATIVQHIDATTLSDGDQLRLWISVNGSDSLHYRWLFGNTPLPGQTADTLRISPATASHQGQYRAIAWNQYGAPDTTAPIPVVVYPRYFAITGSADEGGRILPADSIAVRYGRDTTLRIRPATGFHIADVITGNESLGSVDSVAFTSVTANQAFSVIFERNRCHLKLLAENGGSIDQQDTLVAYAVPCSISATPRIGYTFLSWRITRGNGWISEPGIPLTTVRLYDDSVKINAQFIVNKYSLTVLSDPQGQVVPDGRVTAVHGRAVSVSAVARWTGYIFSHWDVISGAARIEDTSRADTWVRLTSGNAVINAVYIRRQ